MNPDHPPKRRREYVQAPSVVDTFTVTVKQTIAVIYNTNDPSGVHPMTAALDAAGVYLQGNENIGADIQWTWQGRDYRLTCAEADGNVNAR